MTSGVVICYRTRCRFCAYPWRYAVHLCLPSYESTLTTLVNQQSTHRARARDGLSRHTDELQVRSRWHPCMRGGGGGASDNNDFGRGVPIPLGLLAAPTPRSLRGRLGACRQRRILHGSRHKASADLTTTAWLQGFPPLLPIWHSFVPDLQRSRRAKCPAHVGRDTTLYYAL